MKKIAIISIFLFIIGCQQEAVTGYIGQQFLLKADIPDEVGTFDYIWKITDLPEESEITLSDIQFSEDESQAIFIPDVAGHYVLQVTVWDYNDKLGAIAYTYDITNESDQVNKEADAWLNETVDEVPELIEEELTVTEKAPAVEEPEKNDSKPVEEIKKITEQKEVLANFTIQIAAESSIQAAEQAVNKFTSAGFDAYIQEVTTSSNSTMYRVRIGKYATQDDAKADAERLETEFGKDIWITKYQP